MYNRSILTELGKWYNRTHRKPLILRGARQVGKTTAVNLFASRFKQFISINLDMPEEKRIFEEARSFDELYDSIFFLKNAAKAERGTLLFIDEIQNSPSAVKNLRYFYEKYPQLAVIAAGSLLETLIEKEIHFPVGRVEYLAVRPFSFYEFLEAGEFAKELEAINTIPFPNYAHEKLLSLFRTYTLIGGMPEIVKLYLEKRDLTEIKKPVTDLIIAYKDDVEKYAVNNTSAKVLRFIIDNAFKFAAERITFNNFGGSGYRSREISEAFRLLEKTMLLRLIYPTTSTRLPVVTKNKMSPKLHLLDTGLVNFISGIEKEIFTGNDLTDVYKGKIAEHIIGQELLSVQYSPEALITFWVREKRQASAEIDYLYNFNGRLIPVEVKSGASGKLKSLQIFLDNSDADVAVRFYSGKYSVEEQRTSAGKKFKLINLPLFLSPKLKEYITLNSHNN